eukprot:scaffold4263_cov92-Phaeocystis_antarctica.AAC.1
MQRKTEDDGANTNQVVPRVSASCVPQAQATVRTALRPTRTSLGRAVHTAYRVPWHHRPHLRPHLPPRRAHLARLRGALRREVPPKSSAARTAMYEFGCCRVSSRAAVCCVQSIFNSLTRPDIDTRHRAAAEVAQKEWPSSTVRFRLIAIHQVESSVCCTEARTSQGRPTKGYWWAHTHGPSPRLTTSHDRAAHAGGCGGGRFYRSVTSRLAARTSHAFGALFVAKFLLIYITLGFALYIYFVLR